MDLIPVLVLLVWMAALALIVGVCHSAGCADRLADRLLADRRHTTDARLRREVGCGEVAQVPYRGRRAV